MNKMINNFLKCCVFVLPAAVGFAAPQELFLVCPSVGEVQKSLGASNSPSDINPSGFIDQSGLTWKFVPQVSLRDAGLSFKPKFISAYYVNALNKKNFWSATAVEIGSAPCVYQVNDWDSITYYTYSPGYEYVPLSKSFDVDGECHVSSLGCMLSRQPTQR